MQVSNLNIFIAFFAGLVSFLSPCVLPLVPAYIGYMSGSAVSLAGGAKASMGARVSAGVRVSGVNVSTAVADPPPKWAVVSHALVFVLGFTLVFVVVIGGLAGALSYALQDNKRILQQVMGIVLLVLGLHMMGILKIPFLNYDTRRFSRPTGNIGYLQSFLIGTGFALGWTPCVGPVLTGIFTLSLNGKQLEALPLFLAYSLGLGVPFILTALAMGQVSTALKKLTRRTFSLQIGGWQVLDHVNVVSLVSGGLLIMMGLLVFTNTLTILAPAVNWFNI